MFEDLLGYTSDHVWRILKDGPVSGITWNLLERCHNNTNRSYSNNPINTSESDDDYLLRKKNQFEELISQISSQTLDFALLQEADFVRGIAKSPKPDSTSDVLETASHIFSQVMESIGWSFEFDADTEKVLAYSTKNMALVEGSVKRLLPYKSETEVGKQKYALLCANFDVLDSCGLHYRYAIGSFHLRYNDDYTHSFAIAIDEIFQDDRVEYAFFGGDANRPPNRDVPLMVSSVNECTNFYTNYAYFKRVDYFDKVELTDDRAWGSETHPAIKAYDGFSCFESPKLSNNFRTPLKLRIFGSHQWTKTNIGNIEVPALIPSTLESRYTVFRK